MILRLLVTLSLVLNAVSAASACPSDLDPTFGNGGVAERLPAGSNAYFGSPLLQPDGKILVPGQASGHPVIVRYRDDGTIDTAFGEGGVATVPVPNEDGLLTRCALQPDGSIVASGSVDDLDGESAPLLVRFQAGGELDPNFGDSGVVLLPTTQSEGGSFHDVAIRRDGVIVTLRHLRFGVPFSSAVFFEADGRLAQRFGEHGVVTPPERPKNRIGFIQLALLRDDSVLIAGIANNIDEKADTSLVKLRPNGTLDASFGNGGVRVSASKGYEEPSSIGVDGRGGILVAGGSGPAPDLDETRFYARRYLPNGKRDRSYGRGGKTSVRFVNESFRGVAAVSNDGKVVIPGRSYGPRGSDGILVRFDEHGKRDETFPKHGVRFLSLEAYTQVSSVIEDAAGRLLAAGRSWPEAGVDPSGFLVRFKGGQGGDPCSVLCGNGNVDPEEECDDGEANSDTTPDACRTDCRRGECGDQVTDSDEQCDDGNSINTDCCSNICQDPVCGDGVKACTELCDLGSANSNTGSADCRLDCTLPECRDGIKDPGEECDDGNLASEDGCSYQCQIEYCGDDIVQSSMGEQCDTGTENDNFPDACRPNCQLPFCGDGILDSGELCDDGNTSEDDGCPHCFSDHVCGDDIVQEESGEQCDDGIENSYLPDACRPDCKLPRCGDAVADSHEDCDDGNTSDDDACPGTCILD